MPAYWLKPEDPVHPDWFGPLERLAEMVRQNPDVPEINPDHFMFSALVRRRGVGDLYVYKHLATRRFLNVDENLHVWRYTSSDRVGYRRYQELGNVAEALAAVELRRGNLLVTHLRSMAVEDATLPAWLFQDDADEPSLGARPHEPAAPTGTVAPTGTAAPSPDPADAGGTPQEAEAGQAAEPISA
jgi:hypothetical protein